VAVNQIVTRRSPPGSRSGVAFGCHGFTARLVLVRIRVPFGELDMALFGRQFWHIAAAICVMCAVSAADAAPADCVDAADRAERMFDLPSGLLRAIGEVESGVLDRTTRQVAPWPWTVDEAGAGQFFPTADAAVAYVTQQLAAGVRNIDVGCFQISLLYHPEAFTSLDQAFDPAANAEAAARLLVALRARASNWEETAGLYHSATPWRAAAYRDLVVRRWTGATPDGAKLYSARVMPVGGVVVRVILPAWAIRASPTAIALPHGAEAGAVRPALSLPPRRGLPIVQTPSRAPVHG
jgi:hypothetical protein